MIQNITTYSNVYIKRPELKIGSSLLIGEGTSNNRVFNVLKCKCK